MEENVLFQELPDIKDSSDKPILSKQDTRCSHDRQKQLDDEHGMQSSFVEKATLMFFL